MERLFYPNRVAVVGVSNDPRNLGRAIVSNMVKYGFTGEVYPVGPKGGTILGRPIYPSLTDVPAELDLAVILTPARTVPAILDECGRLGIKRAVIESGGFSEYEDDRKGLERDLRDVAQRHGIRFVGPNCIGIINLENGLATPFMSMGTNIGPGHISILTQSGGVGLSYINYLISERLGFNKFVSMGNKLNVNENDLLEYLLEDEGTRIICMYLEGLTDGRRLMELGRRSRKPILVHKSNVGQAAAGIAQSHTAALSGDDAVADAAFKQAGLIRVNRGSVLMNYIKILTLPALKGPNLAVVSRSGGHAVIAADACEHYGFQLPAFSRSFLEEFEQHFRASVIKLRNPLDLGDLFDLDVYLLIVEEMLKRDGIDGILLVHGYTEPEQDAARKFIEALASLVRKYDKPVALCLFVEEAELAYLKQAYQFPVYDSPEDGAQALNLSYQLHHFRETHREFRPENRAVDRERAVAILEQARREDRNPNLAEGFDLLKLYGLEVPPYVRVASADEAARAASEIGFPVVLKADVGSVSHKSDVGGVRLNLQNGDGAAQAFEDMNRRLAPHMRAGEVFHALVQAQAAPGHEVIIGAKQDPNFGPTVLFGLGGIYVEVMEDVSIRVAPLDQREARSMVEGVRGYKILSGLRGAAPSDVDSLVERLIAVSQLAMDFPEIRELDLNPVVVYERGCMALDVRLVTRMQARPTP